MITYFNGEEHNISSVLFKRVSARCVIDIDELINNGKTKLKMSPNIFSPFNNQDYEEWVKQVNAIQPIITDKNTYITLCGFNKSKYKEQIKSLIIPENVTYIHHPTLDFKKCTNLETVVFNERLIDITNGLFDGCNN